MRKTPPRHNPKVLPYIIATLCAAILAGCAYNGTGTVRGDIRNDHERNMAWATVDAIGLIMRSRTDDRGLTLGYRRQVYIFSHTIGNNGTHWFRVPLPDTEAAASHSTTYGVDIELTTPYNGITVGYQNKTTVVKAPSSQSIYVEFGDLSRGEIFYIGPCTGVSKSCRFSSQLE